jgi:hypothetical protein
LAENPNLSILVIEAGKEFVPQTPALFRSQLKDAVTPSKKKRFRLPPWHSNLWKANMTGNTPSPSGTERARRDMKPRTQEERFWVEVVV